MNQVTTRVEDGKSKIVPALGQWHVMQLDLTYISEAKLDEE
jgi:hypothetical protein